MTEPKRVGVDTASTGLTRLELDHEPTAAELDQLPDPEPAMLRLRTDAGPITASDGTQMELRDATVNGHRGAELLALNPEGDWVVVARYFADGSEFTSEHLHPVPNRGIGGRPKRSRRRR